VHSISHLLLFGRIVILDRQILSDRCGDVLFRRGSPFHASFGFDRSRTGRSNAIIGRGGRDGSFFVHNITQCSPLAFLLVATSFFGGGDARLQDRSWFRLSSGSGHGRNFDFSKG